jgi:hypothetical protein
MCLLGFLDFLPLFVGVALAALLAQWLKNTALLLLLAIAGVIGLNVLSMRTPVQGIRTEIGIGLVASIAQALVFVLYLKIGRPQTWGSTKSAIAMARAVGVMLLMMFLLVGVLMTWSDRVRYAMDLAWQCDGVIAEKYRSSNHQIPTLVVTNTDGSKTKLEGVVYGLWNKANIGDRMRKSSGTTRALLNDELLECVRPKLGSHPPQSTPAPNLSPSDQLWTRRNVNRVPGMGTAHRFLHDERRPLYNARSVA